MQLGAPVLSHGERVQSNRLLGLGVQSDLEKLAVGYLSQQNEIDVRYTRKLVSLSSDGI